MDFPINVSFPLLGVGAFTLMLSLIFCCYLWRIRKQGKNELGYVKVKFSKKNKILSNDTCPVCLEEFKQKEQIAICPCSHGFHLKCLIQWLQQRNICPMCKAPVRPILGERSGLVGPLATTSNMSTSNM